LAAERGSPAPARPARLRSLPLPTLAALSAPPAPAVPPVRLPEARSVDPALFPLAVRKIMLDPGHGGPSVGTGTPRGLLEKSLTLDIALRLRQILAARSFSVLLTREEDRPVDLADRAALANRAGADVFVSIHLNWIEDRKARGVETYFL